MPATRANLDGQSDKVLTEPTVQTRIALKDAASTQTLFLDFDQPAGADRTVNFPDPSANDTVTYLNKAQVFQNKQITTVPAAPNDVANKAYVDAAVGAGSGVATSAPGGGTQGVSTFDEDKGLLTVAGVTEVKVATAEGQEFNGTGQLRPKIDGIGVTLTGGGALTVPLATAAPGGGTVGRSTVDSNAGLEMAGSAIRAKVDGASIGFNGSGELEAIAGSNTTLASRGVPFVRTISGVTAATVSTTGTDIDTLDFPDGVTTGQRFHFTVPEDYASGDIEILAVYRMSTAVVAPNNQLRLSTQFKIAEVAAGTIDDITYPETQANVAVAQTTNVTRQLLETLQAGDFAIGDEVQFYIKRFGADGGDLHTGVWKVIGFEWRYTSGRGGRAITQGINLFQDALAETRGTLSTIGTDIDTEDFPTGADSGFKVVFTVPEEWDGLTEAQIRVEYAMSSAALGTVRLNTYGELANTASGAVDALASQNFDLATTSDTNVHRTVTIRSISPTALHKGDFINLILARRVAVGSNHAGSFKVIAVTITFGTPTAAAGLTSESYLGEPVYGNSSAVGVFATVDYPIFGGDFEMLYRLHSTVAAGRVDVAWQGRLSASQSQVRQIRIPVKGTGGYRLKVFVEGFGASPVYDSTLQAAPVGLTTLTVNAVDLSGQPSGSKRYFVVVEVYIDNLEAVNVGRPFVQQE